MISIAASSCAKHRVTKSAENPLLDVRNILSEYDLQRESNSNPEISGRNIGIDLFANFLDQVRQSDKKWEVKTNMNGHNMMSSL